MHRPHSYSQSFLYPFVLFPFSTFSSSLFQITPYFSLPLSFFFLHFLSPSPLIFWLHLIPLNLSPHPCVTFFFSNPRSLLLEQQYVYTRLPWQPEEATWAGGWTKDPETLIHRESERARDGEWEGEREREREREKENQISFLGEGFGVCGKWGGGGGWRGGGGRTG